MKYQHAIGAAVAAFSLAALAGCGPADRTHHVSGKATFDGKPIPKGKIFFDPNVAAGNAGPSGFADIVDGQYDTSRAGGKGTVGGAMTVRVEGYSDQNVDAISGYGKPLFAQYSESVELPKEQSTRDFNVPASAAKGLPKHATPPLDP